MPFLISFLPFFLLPFIFSTLSPLFPLVSLTSHRSLTIYLHLFPSTPYHESIIIMKFASSFAVLGALASIASAFVAPNEPIGNTIWKPNTQVSINWRDDGVAPALSTKPTFDISFMTGSNLAMVKLATIATNITGDTTSFTWTVPYVSPPGQSTFPFFSFFR